MELREYQKVGVAELAKILRKRSSALLADEMGLGKTSQAIAIKGELTAKTMLVVAPASLRINWAREIKSWTGEDACVIMKGVDLKQLKQRPDIVIVSYNLFADNVEKFSRLWDFVVLDEAHFLKNPKSKRTKACLKTIWKSAVYRLLLTGTPLPNSVMDGWSLFNACAPEMFPNQYQYGHRYTNAERNWYTGLWEFKGGRNLPELKQKLYSTFMVRRRKSTVLSELPPKIYQQVVITPKLNPELEIDEATITAIRDAIKEGRELSVSSACSTLRRALGLCKVAEIISHVQMVLEEKQKVVVFAYHKDTVKLLAKAFSTYGCVTLSGDTPASKRQGNIDAFQTDPKVRVFLGQITAAGIGVTLTAADMCIFAELDWVPANMAQAIDRLHRMGQKSVVQVQYLIAQGSMDEQIIDVLQEKIQAIGGVM